MITHATSQALRPDRLNRLHDLAHEQAVALRRDAIDGFWRGADAVLTKSVTSSQRAASRFAARLAQHARQRGSAGGALQGCRSGVGNAGAVKLVRR